MKKSKLAIVLLSAIATMGLMMPAIAGPTDAAATQDDDQAKGRSFNGKVEKIDATAKTITVDGKVFSVTDTTKLTKLGKAIALTDISVGDEVRGKSREVDGKTEAVSVMVSTGKGKDA